MRADIVIAIIAFLLILMFIAALVFFGYDRWEPASAQTTQQNLYEGIAVDAKLLELDKHALNEAYHSQLVKLWTIWLTDGGQDSSRFRKGLANARRAYAEAAIAIAKREQQLQDARP